MAEDVSEGESVDGVKRRSPAVRLGRRIAGGVFWISALYMAAVGFYSITAQVFWPSEARATDVGCAEGLDSLRAGLLAYASEVVARGGLEEEASLRRWFRTWDHRHASLAAACEAEGTEVHRDLDVLRHRMETLLLRLGREQRPLLREVDLELRRLHID